MNYGLAGILPPNDKELKIPKINSRGMREGVIQKPAAYFYLTAIQFCIVF
ncbi:MAG: hypothetical protein ACJ72S_00665 [Nitrososphaeraceae archaeon]